MRGPQEHYGKTISPNCFFETVDAGTSRDPVRGIEDGDGAAVGETFYHVNAADITRVPVVRAHVSGYQIQILNFRVKVNYRDIGLVKGNQRGPDRFQVNRIEKKSVDFLGDKFFDLTDLLIAIPVRINGNQPVAVFLHFFTDCLLQNGKERIGNVKTGETECPRGIEGPRFLLPLAACKQHARYEKRQ